MLATRGTHICYVRRDSHDNDQLVVSEYSPLLCALGFPSRRAWAVVGRIMWVTRSSAVHHAPATIRAPTRELQDLVLAYDRARKTSRSFYWNCATSGSDAKIVMTRVVT